MKKKIITLSMRDQMYDALRDLILKNDYGPNAVLQIDRLAEEFGVSATPVREALVRLEADGLVTLIPNKGAQVTDIQEVDIRNTWELRKLLEPYAAAQSAELIPLEEIETLRNDILAMKEMPFSNERYVNSDSRLHEMLYMHLTNTALKDMIRRVHQMSIRIRYYPEGSALMHERVVNEVIGEHLEILAAARIRDAARMAELVRLHLQNGERRAMSALAGNR
jgi:DNA-binding GntR family transcriptional regulator